MEQAGHEIILQVEGDDRCASVLRTQFPRARLERNLTALETLPAETEVLVGTLPWPEEQDDDNKARAVVEQAHAARQFTDTANFALRCLVCQLGLKGEKEAVEHAKATGHQNFGEY